MIKCLRKHKIEFSFKVSNSIWSEYSGTQVLFAILLCHLECLIFVSKVKQGHRHGHAPLSDWKTRMHRRLLAWKLVIGRLITLPFMFHWSENVVTSPHLALEDFDKCLLFSYHGRREREFQWTKAAWILHGICSRRLLSCVVIIGSIDRIRKCLSK